MPDRLACQTVAPRWIARSKKNTSPAYSLFSPLFQLNPMQPHEGLQTDHIISHENEAEPMLPESVVQPAPTGSSAPWRTRLVFVVGVVLALVILPAFAFNVYRSNKHLTRNVEILPVDPSTRFPNWSLPTFSLFHQCDRIVVTSVNLPTTAVIRFSKLAQWRVVVVGDKKSPSKEEWAKALPNVVFLSVEDQAMLPYSIIQLLPYGHYGRKNIGYLYAIHHGAQLIYETDDDNDLSMETIPVIAAHSSLLVVNSTWAVRRSQVSVNPYAHFGHPSVWPRGYPLDLIEDGMLQPPSEDAVYCHCTDSSVFIQQGLANGDPDVDAIFRLTRKPYHQKINITFWNSAPVAYYPGTFSPFNSQNTLFHTNALWGLLIPISTTFRVCDIWRGYWAQRLLWEIGGRLAFLPPTVFQDRNVHNYLKDYMSERPMYENTGRLLEMLTAWRSASPHFFDRLVELSEAFERGGFWGAADAELARAWVADLRAIGYPEPQVVPDLPSVPIANRAYAQRDCRRCSAYHSSQLDSYVMPTLEHGNRNVQPQCA